MDDEDIDRKHDLDWTKVSEAKAREVYTLGQVHLEAQLQTALAADARATAMANLFVTLGLAVLAAGLGYWQAKASWSLLLGSMVTSACFLWAAFHAASAAQPVGFYLPGTHPEQWFNSLDEDMPTLLGGQAEIDDRDIRRNARQLATSAGAVKCAFAWAVFAPIGGFIIWGAIVLFFG